MDSGVGGGDGVEKGKGMKGMGKGGHARGVNGNVNGTVNGHVSGKEHRAPLLTTGANGGGRRVRFARQVKKA